MDSGVKMDSESWVESLEGKARIELPWGGESLEGTARIERPSSRSSALGRAASSGTSFSRSLPEPVSTTDIEEALGHLHSESDVVAVRHPSAGVDMITEGDVAMMKIPLPGLSKVDSADSQMGSDAPSGSGSGSTNVKESIKKALGMVPNTKSAPSLNFVDAAPEESSKNANGGLFQPVMRFMSTKSASMVTIPKLGEGSPQALRPGSSHHRPSSSQGQAAAQRREQEERSEQFRALSYLRKAREQRKGNDKAMDPTMMDATSSWVLQHSMSVGELNKIQVKSVTTAQYAPLPLIHAFIHPCIHASTALPSPLFFSPSLHLTGSTNRRCTCSGK